jgi:hypothetical protein
MNDIETAPSLPPRVRREKQLVDPSGANQKPGYHPVNDSRMFMVPKLREDVEFVALCQAFDERHCVTLGPAS